MNAARPVVCKVDEYAVRMLSPRSITDLHPDLYVAAIDLYDETHEYRGTARFHPDGTDLKSPEVDSDGRAMVHFNLSQFQGTIDMLRNEKPVHFFASTTFGCLSTGREPVGEEELKI